MSDSTLREYFCLQNESFEKKVALLSLPFWLSSAEKATLQAPNENEKKHTGGTDR